MNAHKLALEATAGLPSLRKWTAGCRLTFHARADHCYVAISFGLARRLLNCVRLPKYPAIGSEVRLI